jgi:HNH endonuclease
MNPEKKWSRYTRIGDIFVNMTKYKSNLHPASNGCLNWQGPKHAQGYGMIGYLTTMGKRKMTVVHRIAMRLKLGREIVSSEDVRHACGNNLCCNPAHLYIRNVKESNVQQPHTTKVPDYAE